jgi:hypothetical protein
VNFVVLRAKDFIRFRPVINGHRDVLSLDYRNALDNGFGLKSWPLSIRNMHSLLVLTVSGNIRW